MAQWGKIGSRGNVEDRRGLAPVIGGVGITGVALLILLNLLTGGDPIDVLSQLENIPIEPQQNYDKSRFEGEDEYEVFASTVLGSNNDMWRNTLAKSSRNYSEPKLVLFRSSAETGCGMASSAVGPFYCPLDETIYLDETFFDEMTSRFGARGGDVAEAYVISHEVAHHVQNMLGIMDEVLEVRQSGGGDANESSIKLELQADCLAGLWANSIKDLDVFEPGEIHEAMDAAEAVGDDRIQETVTGRVSPENWTHGSSAQRVSWFNRGYESGNLSECDTVK